MPNQTTMGDADLTLANALVTSLTSNFSFQHAIQAIPFFDGQNISLKDYIQDLRNGEIWVSDEQKGLYLKAILGRLRGPARNSTCDLTFRTLEDFIKHLKSRFATGKNFAYYNMQIQTLRMKQGQTVREFYDQLKILLSSAESALKEEKGEAYKSDMMVPLRELAIDIFIRGLPTDISRGVDVAKPTKLSDAFSEANRIESRMNSRILPDTRYHSSSMLIGQMNPLFSKPSLPNSSQYTATSQYPNHVGHPPTNFNNFHMRGRAQLQQPNSFSLNQSARGPLPSSARYTNPQINNQRQYGPQNFNYSGPRIQMQQGHVPSPPAYVLDPNTGTYKPNPKVKGETSAYPSNPTWRNYQSRTQINYLEPLDPGYLHNEFEGYQYEPSNDEHLNCYGARPMTMEASQSILAQDMLPITQNTTEEMQMDIAGRAISSPRSGE